MLFHHRATDYGRVIFKPRLALIRPSETGTSYWFCTSMSGGEGHGATPLEAWQKWLDHPDRDRTR